MPRRKKTTAPPETAPAETAQLEAAQSETVENELEEEIAAEDSSVTIGELIGWRMESLIISFNSQFKRLATITRNHDLMLTAWLMLNDLDNTRLDLRAGKRGGWIAGILYALRKVNGAGRGPHAWFPDTAAVCEALGVSQQTMERRGKEIYAALLLEEFEPRFVLAGVLRDEAVFWTQTTPDGRTVDLRTLPRELQEEAVRAGVIPYVPADYPEGLIPVIEMLQRRLGELEEKGGEPAPPSPLERVYTLKITLSPEEPEVWRRVELRDCTFLMLHAVIQHAFDWEDCHLWEFQVGGRKFGLGPDDGFFSDDSTSEPAEERLLSGVLGKKTGKKFTYTYDFGDWWEHFIEVEAVGEPQPGVAYPRLLEGAGAAPPEDCGGIYRFYEILNVLEDPADPDHEEFREYYPQLAASFEFDAARTARDFKEFRRQLAKL